MVSLTQGSGAPNIPYADIVTAGCWLLVGHSMHHSTNEIVKPKLNRSGEITKPVINRTGEFRKPNLKDGPAAGQPAQPSSTRTTEVRKPNLSATQEVTRLNLNRTSELTGGNLTRTRELVMNRTGEVSLRSTGEILKAAGTVQSRMTGSFKLSMSHEVPKPMCKDGVCSVAWKPRKPGSAA